MQSLIKIYAKKLNLFMLLAIVLGVAFGFFFPEFSKSISFLGEIFLRLLSLLIVPVIVISMISGVLGLEDKNSLGRFGLKTIIYYTLTTALAVVTGLILVNILKPGLENTLASKATLSISDSLSKQQVSLDQGLGISEVIKQIFPKNIIQAASEGNILGLIFFSILIAIALLSIKHPGTEILKNIFNASFEAIIKLVDWVMYAAPIGILSLVANLSAEFISNGNFIKLGSSIFSYSLTVTTGLLFHGIISLSVIAYLFKINPFALFKAMLPALTTAFSSASSTASLPLTIDSLENRAGVPNKFASFVAPLGATINMDGTAIYEAIAAVFIANMYGVELSFNQQIIIFLTATLSAVGAAGIPGAGLIMMTLILNSVGLPVQGIQLIVIVDRVLDMLRTSINVWGDSVGAAVLAVSEGAELKVGLFKRNS
ncbi:MAG: dicarboxylate/amino acid:cation symporter [Bdellovibrionales bacterium]|nr:dicarboxylate/amino acid:cation symporter [Bdellovibrionales bacterium]